MPHLTHEEAASILCIGVGRIPELIEQGQLVAHTYFTEHLTRESVLSLVNKWVYPDQPYSVWNCSFHNEDHFREATFVHLDDADLFAKAAAKHHKNPFMTFVVMKDRTPICMYECDSETYKITKTTDVYEVFI